VVYMQYPFTSNLTVTPVPFQNPIQEPEEDKGAPFLSLPLEILERIGSHYLDGKTAIAYTKTCRRLYLARPKILTTSPRLLQWTVKQLVIHEKFLKSFLEDHCTTSTCREASFTLTASLKSSNQRLMKAHLPHVKVEDPLSRLVHIEVARRIDDIARVAFAVANIPGVPFALPQITATVGVLVALNGLREWLQRDDPPVPQQNAFIAAPVDPDDDLYA